MIEQDFFPVGFDPALASKDELVHYFQKLIERPKDEKWSQALIGYWLQMGYGAHIDLENAAIHYRAAANLGSEVAAYNLGQIHYKSGEFAEAHHWLERSVALGEPRAFGLLGSMYQYGRGVTKDVGKAIQYYLRGVQLTNISSIVNLAVLVRTSTVEGMTTKAAMDLLKSVEDSNDSGVLFELGLYHLEGIDAENGKSLGRDYIEKSAELGYPPAQAWCGEFYALKAEKRDLPKALRFLELASEAAEPRAQYVLAVLLAKGISVNTDSYRAFKLCSLAAESEDKDAMNMLSLMYERGDGCESNAERALHWRNQCLKGEE